MKRYIITILLLCTIAMPCFADGLDANTQLLLHFEEPSTDDVADGAFEILDAVGSHVVTQVGDSVLQTTTTKFGSSALTLDGTGDYLTIPGSADFNLGGDLTDNSWTVAFWVKHSATPSSVETYMGCDAGSNVKWWIYNYSVTPSIGFRLYHGSGYALNLLSTPYAIGDTDWHHIAAVIVDGEGGLYVDGNKAANATVSQTMTTSTGTCAIGTEADFSGPTAGAIDDLIVTNSNIFSADPTSAATITVPTSAHTTDVNTKLLLPFDTQDVSGDGGSDAYHIPEYVGDAHTTASGKFAQSGRLDGDSDYWSSADSDDWYFNGDFTVSFWIYATAEPDNYTTLVSQCGSTFWLVSLEGTNNVLRFKSYDGSQDGEFTTPFEPVLGRWYHIEFARNGSTPYFFIDGVAGSVTTVNAFATFTNLALPLQIGYCSNWASTGYFEGYIDDLQLVKGTALHTSGFTPEVIASEHASTVLWMPFDDEDDYDLSTENHTITENGTAQVGKFGGSSIFDGTGDYISIPDSADWQLGGGTGDFTIDLWAYLSSDVDTKFVGQKDGTTYWKLDYVVSASYLLFASYTGGTADLYVADTAWNPSTATWYHLAVVRKGTTTNDTAIYVDGVDVTDSLVLGAWDGTIPNVSAPLFLGSTDGTNDELVGNLDEVRISDSARWTTGFTPPTEAYAVVSAGTRRIIIITKFTPKETGGGFDRFHGELTQDIWLRLEESTRIKIRNEEGLDYEFVRG